MAVLSEDRDAPGVQLSRLAPARRVLLESIAAELLPHYGRGRTTIAIAGPGDTARFADDLALAFQDRDAVVFRASIDDFLLPRAQRTGTGYDVSLLRRVLLDPFRMGGSAGFTLAGFDRARDVPFETSWTTGPADALLLIDGEHLLDLDLRGLWHASVAIDADLAASITVDDTDPEHPQRRWLDSC